MRNDKQQNASQGCPNGAFPVFILQLLPGQRREDGVPESLHFWKTRIEGADPQSAFNVGLIYGPSGCGKTSLVRAGLLPNLAEHVTAVYVEATADDTEERLLAALRDRCSYLSPKTSLRAALRRKGEIPDGTKVLIVLDQFEQWRHARPTEDERHALAEALAECDGRRLQCVVLVREEYVTPVTRFFNNQLNVQLSQDRNYALVDLFGKRHAGAVLTMFSRAFGALPKTGSLSDEQQRFVESAVDDLAQGDFVICIRLTLFAEMVRARKWTPKTLRALGGIQGVGVKFLEDNLNPDSEVLEHRPHHEAAQRVLKRLLPEEGVDLKGSMRSRDELLEASGYVRQPNSSVSRVARLSESLRNDCPFRATQPLVNWGLE